MHENARPASRPDLPHASARRPPPIGWRWDEHGVCLTETADPRHRWALLDPRTGLVSTDPADDDGVPPSVIRELVLEAERLDLPGWKRTLPASDDHSSSGEWALAEAILAAAEGVDNPPDVCPECSGTGMVPSPDPPSWANPYGEPPEQCPRGCEVPA
jgi:hypothetical protein